MRHLRVLPTRSKVLSWKSVCGEAGRNRWTRLQHQIVKTKNGDTYRHTDRRLQRARTSKLQKRWTMSRPQSTPRQRSVHGSTSITPKMRSMWGCPNTRIANGTIVKPNIAYANNRDFRRQPLTSAPITLPTTVPIKTLGPTTDKEVRAPCSNLEKMSLPASLVPRILVALQSEARSDELSDLFRAFIASGGQLRVSRSTTIGSNGANVGPKMPKTRYSPMMIAGIACQRFNPDSAFSLNGVVQV